MVPLTIVGISNSIPEGILSGVTRILRIPFGAHAHPSGKIQQVNAGTAGKIVTALRTMLANRKPAPVVYNGHPDEGAGAPPDPNEYGRVTDAAVEPGALALTCSLTDAGLALVRAGKRWFSPHWLAYDAGEAAIPFELLSIGLTDRPVIPVSPIANQKPPREGQKGGPMRDKLLALLKARGIELAAEASDDEIVAAIEAEFGKSVNLANDLAARDAEIVNLKGQVEATKGEADKAKADLSGATTALANERTERRKALLAQAIADGRVPPAAVNTWEAEFDKDFSGAVVKLANAKPVVKTGGRTDGDGGRLPGKDGVGRILALVNEEMKTTGSDYDTAFGRVKARSPELFGK